ncbi:DUF998 domain-containing protein [Angustibacter sp. McL0619]|uniref:DUF998 domain-containing protein n=1 Tax=Angustibacter sp. McL0619 TaxID=3415676 RepID=UPI003CECCAF1
MTSADPAADPAALTPPPDESEWVLSYLGVRLSVGVLGAALPVLLFVSRFFFGDHRLPPSISAFYYTPMRNVLVGTLCAQGVFLFSYRYARRDNWLSTLAAILVVIVALSPTAAPGAPDTFWTIAHGVAAGGFYLVLAYFSYFLFTRSDAPVEPGSPKALRNSIYRVCGVLVVLAMAVALALLRSPVHLLFWCETVASLAFSFAWLVKGGLLFADQP